jgi:SMI1 / KNR4 family (SUKH-1)
VVVKKSPLLDDFDCHPPATDAAITSCGKELGLQLPGDYVEFLKTANGGEGFIGRVGFANLWSVEELPSLNRAYEVQKIVPGLLLFGSNGSGEAYGFDMRNLTRPVVQVPFVGMEWQVAEPMGNSFIDFLWRLHRLE